MHLSEKEIVVIKVVWSKLSPQNTEIGVDEVEDEFPGDREIRQILEALAQKELLRFSGPEHRSISYFKDMERKFLELQKNGFKKL